MKKYYCPKHEEEVPKEELEPTGESDILGVEEKGIIAGMVYKHSKCGTIVEEVEEEN